jgi:hypothetical protein
MFPTFMSGTLDIFSLGHNSVLTNTVSGPRLQSLKQKIYTNLSMYKERDVTKTIKNTQFNKETTSDINKVIC